MSFTQKIYFAALTGMEVEDKDVFGYDDEVMTVNAWIIAPFELALIMLNNEISASSYQKIK